jgi:hypothetical protein
MSQDVFQIGARVDAIEPARPNQAIHRCRPLASAVGAGEQIVFASERDAAQGVFGQRVADLDATVFAVQHERVSLVERVADCLGQFRFPRQRRELVRHPRLDGREQLQALLLPHAQPFGGRLAADASLDAIEFADQFKHVLSRRRRRTRMHFV